MQLGLKINLDCPCKSGSCALKPKGHPYKAVLATWGYERGLLFVFLHHEDLVVPRIGIRNDSRSHPAVESTIWSMRGRGKYLPDRLY